MDKTQKSKKRKRDALSGNENKSETEHENKKRRYRQFEGNLQPNLTNEPTEEKPTEDNPKPDYNEYWSEKITRRKDPNSFLKLNIMQQDLIGHLPVYIDKGGAIDQSLGPFFSNRTLEHRILSIYGIPGLGKTTTIQTLARLHQCAYLRITSHCGLTASMIKEMDLICLKAKKMTAKELMLKLDYISVKTIQSLLQSTSEAIKADKFILNHEKNCLHQFIEPGVLALPLGEELVTKVLLAKKEQLQYNSTLNVEDLVIVHFDDCQSWVSPQYKHKMDDKLIENGIEARMYQLISFSECLPYTPSNFRFAFTGTHFEVDRLLRFDSKMKPVLANVNLTTVEDVKYLLNLFVDVTKIDDEIISELVGPYRMVQLFLKWLYSGQSVEEAKESAYKDWIDMEKLCYLQEGDTIASFCQKLIDARANSSGKDLYDEIMDRETKAPATIAFEVLKKVTHQLPDDVAKELAFKLIKQETNLVNALVELQNADLDSVAAYCIQYTKPK